MTKLPTFGNVIFRGEGQYAVLGKVALHGKVGVLGEIAFLGKVAAVVIDSIVLVLLLVTLVLLPLLHPRRRQQCTCIFDLIAMAPLPVLWWRCPPSAQS